MSEKITLHIRNMVCSRCELVLETALTALGLKVNHIELGKAEVIREGEMPSMSDIEKELNRFNFGLIVEEDESISEKIKIELIKLLDHPEIEDVVMSDYLAKNLNKNYAQLSRTFTKQEEITIEKYFIRLKIEKVKEKIVDGGLSFSEIAYSLGYKNQQHLSRQFKEITGMSMSEFAKVKEKNRKSLDQIS